LITTLTLKASIASIMNSEDIFNSQYIDTSPLQSIDLSKKTNSELMLFLGAGASVPAKIPGVENMVQVL
jgi:hypothetical protein